MRGGGIQRGGEGEGGVWNPVHNITKVPEECLTQGTHVDKLIFPWQTLEALNKW
jgi:hypothetical protein